MCVTDRGVGFEEEGESGFERECGLSEKAERGEGHPDCPLGDIVLAACCEHGILKFGSGAGKVWRVIQETTGRPEKTVKVIMGIAALSLLTIAVCMVILVSRGNPVVMRRQVMPMENRMPMIPGMMPQGASVGQGMPEGMNRPGQPKPVGQPPEKPATK